MFSKINNKFFIIYCYLFRPLSIFKKKLNNKSIAILCPGKSLKKTDFKRFRYFISINRMFHYYKKYKITPIFHVFTDGNWIKANAEDINKIKQLKFIPFHFRKYISKDKYTFFYYLKSQTKQKFEISDIYIGDHFSVVYSAINLAILMGCKEFFICGNDQNIVTRNKNYLQSNVQKDYFDKNYVKKNYQWNPPKRQVIKQGFYKIRKYCDQNNIKINNYSLFKF